MAPQDGAVRAREQRQKLTASQLYAKLDREFRARKPSTCATCQMPLPYYRESPDDVSTNWYIGTPRDCPELCHTLIAQILTEAWARYELR